MSAEQNTKPLLLIRASAPVKIPAEMVRGLKQAGYAVVVVPDGVTVESLSSLVLGDQSMAILRSAVEVMLKPGSEVRLTEFAGKFLNDLRGKLPT